VTYLLDTDICSYIIRSPFVLREKFESVSAGEIAISSITWAELHSWIVNSTKPERRLLSLQKMFAPVSILPFNATDATFHGPIRKHLKERGQLIGALDILIAAHGVSRGLIIVTNNTEHFSRVPQLKVENWLSQ